MMLVGEVMKKLSEDVYFATDKEIRYLDRYINPKRCIKYGHRDYSKADIKNMKMLIKAFRRDKIFK